MTRFRFTALGLCIALAACGEKFVAHSGAGESGGASGAGGTLVLVAGATSGGGAGRNDASSGSAGEAGEGEAGSGTGGAGGEPEGSGTGGVVQVGTGGSSGSSGSSGSAGSGGALVEPTLPQGLALWLRADRGVQVKDGLVQVWQDQSDNKMHATQNTPSLRPAFRATGFNARPALEFDGQVQFLNLPEAFGDFSKGLAGLIVAKPTKSDCAAMVEFSNGTEIEDISLGMWQDKWTYEVESPFIQAGTVDHSLFSLYAVNHRGMGASELRINGSVLGTLEMPLPAIPTSGVRSDNYVGHTLYAGCEYFKGQISEVIIYSRTLTNVELTAIERYLDAHWSISTQELPTPTP